MVKSMALALGLCWTATVAGFVILCINGIYFMAGLELVTGVLMTIAVANLDLHAASHGDKSS